VKLKVIKDVNGREKLILANSLRVIDHEVRDAIHGGTITEKYVEVVVVGRHRNTKWKEWYPLKKFLEMNPNITLEELMR